MAADSHAQRVTTGFAVASPTAEIPRGIAMSGPPKPVRDWTVKAARTINRNRTVISCLLSVFSILHDLPGFCKRFLNTYKFFMDLCKKPLTYEEKSDKI
jgi:hypothetical protein